jgi:iron(III) transport system substrate-binding protein
MYFFLRQKYGLDFWKKLRGQDPRIYPTASPVATDLERGEIALGLDPIDSFVASMKSGAPVKIGFPSDGIPSYGIAGGITATAPHPNAAQLWMNWLTSRRGGAAIASVGSYPIDGPVPSAAGLTYPPYQRLYNIRIEDWERLREPFTREWHQIFGGG